jgi:hypothetical protein
MRVPGIEREFLAILRNLAGIGALDHLVLIGSWVLPVYVENLGIAPIPFTTTDVDFSVIRPHDRTVRSDPSVRQRLTELGYTSVAEPLTGAERYVPAIDAAENRLTIDFLCEPGRIVRALYHIPGLGITSTPIRFQRVLLENTERMAYKRLLISVPKPAFWAAHKIAISQLRAGELAEPKMFKDLDSAAAIVDLNGEAGICSAAETYPGKFLGLFRKGWGRFARRRA